MSNETATQRRVLGWLKANRHSFVTRTEMSVQATLGTVRALQQRGWIETVGDRGYVLTDTGRAALDKP